MDSILLALASLLGFTLSLFALACGLWAIIEVKALQRSTHKIEWRPMGAPEDDKANQNVDNTEVDAFGDDDLFMDDIDLFLDKKHSIKKGPPPEL